VFLLWAKIKASLAALFWGAIAILLPVLYILGRKDGASKEQVQKAEEAVKAEKKKAEFYREMGEDKDEIVRSKPTNKSDLVNRLRNNGL